MPIYAYACDACGHRQDHLQKMSDALIAVCPQCASASYSKQLSAPQFQLKGGGWYVTDFRDNGKKDVSKSDGEGKSEGKSADAAAASGSKSDTQSDSKSESKSDSGGAASTPAAATPSTPAASSASSTPSTKAA